MADLDALLDAHPNVERDEQSIKLDPEAFLSVKARTEEGIDHFVGAIVRNDDGEFVLVKNWWSDGWIVPGGGVEVGETFERAVAREVEEETGLDVAVEVPILVVDQTFVCRGETVWNAFVVFEASVETTTLAANPGVHDEEIEDVAWFDSVPENCADADVLEPVLDGDQDRS